MEMSFIPLAAHRSLQPVGVMEVVAIVRLIEADPDGRGGGADSWAALQAIGAVNWLEFEKSLSIMHDHDL